MGIHGTVTVTALARESTLFHHTIPNDHPAQWHTPETTYINELSPT